MPDLFDLAMPWWEFILRAVVVYAVVLGMVRLSGKRALGMSNWRCWKRLATSPSFRGRSPRSAESSRASARLHTAETRVEPSPRSAAFRMALQAHTQSRGTR
ncbi:hypothetical protein [Stenotrophomonas indicatrix]|uniref:hypothetical protein n=1 Tax=Stenotrophomonas indicatrix TaxID=2045451 RepID=UPI0013D9A963|nr:hypothetical protein [Stenotrophomonas indicatrix]